MKRIRIVVTVGKGATAFDREYEVGGGETFSIDIPDVAIPVRVNDVVTGVMYRDDYYPVGAKRTDDQLRTIE